MRRIASVSVLTVLMATLTVPATVSADVAAPALRTQTVRVEDAAASTTQDGNALEAAADLDDKTVPIDAPIEFNGMWATVPDDADALRVRTHTAGEGWSDWVELEPVDPADDGPDPGTEEARQAAAHSSTSETVTEYLAVGAADAVEVGLLGADGVEDVDITFVDSDGLNESLLERTARRLSPRPAPAEASVLPSWIQPRSAWNAAPPKSDPSTASNGVRMVVVHHTAGRNGYSQAEVPGIIRGVQHWHQQGNGWSDIGYNAVVDRFGGVWEGRAGGLDRAVIGAHARNFNTGSFGVSVLGDYTGQQASQAALDAVARVIGWKADLHDFDPTGTVDGQDQLRPVIVGHRDVGQTSCPGLIQQRLPEIRVRAKQLAGPFADVYRGPHVAAVERLAAQGVLNGCKPGLFCPGDHVTRAQVASMLQRALELPEADGSTFTDVPAGWTHERAIGAVSSKGFLRGYSDGGFRPGAPITREQVASSLARAMGLPPHRARIFEDVDPYSVHGGNIGALYLAQVAQGCTASTFCADTPVTREQMASFIDRMLRLR